MKGDAHFAVSYYRTVAFGSILPNTASLVAATWIWSGLQRELQLLGLNTQSAQAVAGACCGAWIASTCE